MHLCGMVRGRRPKNLRGGDGLAVEVRTAADFAPHSSNSRSGLHAQRTATWLKVPPQASRLKTKTASHVGSGGQWQPGEAGTRRCGWSMVYTIDYRQYSRCPCPDGRCAMRPTYPHPPPITDHRRCGLRGRRTAGAGDGSGSGEFHSDS
jgi:hypothetical protein